MTANGTAIDPVDINIDSFTWTGGSILRTDISDSVSVFDSTIISGISQTLGIDFSASGTITHQSSTLTIDGGFLLVQPGAVYTMGGAAIDEGLSFGYFANLGELRIDGGSSSIDTTFDNTGLVNVEDGTLDLTATVSQIVGTALTGGEWDIASGSTLNTPGSNLTVNQGDVTLRGTASFPKFADVVDNQATFALRESATFATNGNFTNSGDFTVDDSSEIVVLELFTQSGGTTTVDGTMRFFTLGSAPAVVVNGGTLRGDGSIDPTGTGFSVSVDVNSGATLAPGDSGSVGSLEVLGMLTTAVGSTSSFRLADGAAGTNYDTVVAGLTTLGGNLSLTAVGTITPGQQYTLIDSDSAITGNFAGAAEGATVTDGVNNYTITYAGGGDGFDVVLTAQAGGGGGETVVETSSGSLAITDTNANDDQLTITTSGSNYVITSASNNLVTTIPTATGDGTTTITVPFSAITGRQVSFSTGDGNDTVTVGGTFNPSNDVSDPSSVFDLLLTLGSGSDTVNWNGASTIDELVVGAETINLNADASTTLDQSYLGNVALGADVVLTAGTDVDFAFLLNGAQNLTINAAGTTTFGSVVGSTTPLSSLTTNSSGSTVIESDVTTTGDQSYGDNVRLDSSVLLTSSAGVVRFLRNVDGTTAGAESLTIDGDAFFNGNAGIGVELDSLTVNGATSTNINSRFINTTNDQTYNGSFQAVQVRTLNSSAGGDITFASTVDAAVNGDTTFTINTSGFTTFLGSIGTTTLLGDLITDAAGATVFGASVTDVRTRNDQLFNDTVTLNGSTTFTAEEGSFPANITFADLTVGENALAAHANNTVTVAGASRLPEPVRYR